MREGKAALKRTQSKRWRDYQVELCARKTLDALGEVLCVRLVAANLVVMLANFVVGGGSGKPRY
jgi:hypothetical protein